jgi:hypothetical protein
MIMRAFLIASIGFVGTTAAHARPEWKDPVSSTHVNCGFLDPNYIRTPCTPQGSKDPRDTWRQHTGTDFRATANETVFAPVGGEIVIFEAEPWRPADEAFLVIRDSQTGEEHVLGHISSTLFKGAVIAKGVIVGKVRDQGGKTHFHWGFNVKSVARAKQKTSTCFRDGVIKPCIWGWGKAPYEATSAEVRDQGWRNVL